jgi:hypothetical protein
LTSGRRSLPSQGGRLSMASSDLDALLDEHRPTLAIHVTPAHL